MRYILAVITMLVSISISAQEPANGMSAVTLCFQLNQAEIDATYRGNRQALNELDRIFVSQTEQVDSVVIHSTSSPDGKQVQNRILSRRRGESVISLLRSKFGLPLHKIKLHTTDENTEGLLAAVTADDQMPYREEILTILNLPLTPDQKEARIRSLHNGRAFQYLKEKHLDDLRTAVLFVMYLHPSPIAQPEEVAAQPDTSIVQPQPEKVKEDTILQAEPAFVSEPTDERLYRWAVLSIKTNLLQDVAFVPQYGFCPIWNLGIEYYPLRGHWTASAQMDFPWWKGNTTNHKYFQIRNYQLEGRRYFREDGIFTGWYAGAYAHAGLFAIGFSATKGWQGESVGAGLSGGYVLPISRNGHWKLEFNLQIGYMHTQYDPYIFGCEEENDNEHYFYDWQGDDSQFSKRQHRHNWIGPTRVGITLSYDLLYRPVKKAKGLSLKAWEKGGAR